MRERRPVSDPPKGPRRTAFATLVALLPYLWPRGETELRLRVAAAMACLVAAKLVNVTVPIFYKSAIDALTPSGPGAVVALPVALIVGYGLVRVLAQGFGELRDTIFAKVAVRAVRRIALETFQHLHRLSLKFHLERRTGGLSRAIERGMEGTSFLLSLLLFSIFPTLLEIALVTGILWGLYSIDFALVTLATIVVYVIFTTVVSEWRVKFRREKNERDSEANGRAIDSLLNYETVKYFGNEAMEARRYDGALALYERASLRTQTSLSALNVGQGAIIAVGLTLIMLLAGSRVASGEMTIGDFVLVNTYLLQLYVPLNALGFVYRNLRQSLIDLEQLFQLLDVAEDVRDPPGAVPLPLGPGRVRFADVSFAYDPRRPILRDISFEAAPGARVAIVGPSGAGKSTVARLLFRFYDAGEGRIEIDGADMRTVTQASVRAAIGVVPQDTVLFNDTIFYNIAYGRPDASRAEVEEAARLARLHDFIQRLPDGYETQVGERGLKLSGGEKQRVAIARVILKAPRILLFDEATSALDSNTEQEIQASLDQVAAGRTTIVIAHRLSTVIDADLILVLDGGRIVERGRHGELVALDGLYAEMWRRQSEAARLADQLARVGSAEAGA
ncbi:ATP-binding cassette subfamily B protein [Stella humosa]|uniref:ATP-binding cassette subfamily B protein n=1 Tax=Stella humosa TaxID=94 RepID=A0A3N1KTZ4_9PROT|nr:ABC transporter ATP-binding protein/permease [Stella humosa]ROP84051.1 ATP-binding cassette subfamily B protein [Stella humosa]BBK33562.1 ABC transporter ATP-binding protein [Stella humosa]